MTGSKVGLLWPWPLDPSSGCPSGRGLLGLTSDCLDSRSAWAVAVVAFNPKHCKNRSCLSPTWTREELGKRSGIERFFGRVFLFFHLQHFPLTG